jgi:murein DD-endopeptidase MepM/ murein hydrolase activator NlpD
MSKSAALTFARLAARLSVAGFAGVWLAGCSSDVTRLSENPFSNPFAAASNDQPPTSGANGSVASAAPNASYAAAAHPSPVAVSALPAPAPATTGAIKPSAPQPVTGFGNGWSVAGGSPIIVADGETLETISQRYGVPTSALLQANGFASSAQVHPGTRLIVPVYNAAGGNVAASDKKSHVADAEASSPAKSKRERDAKDKKEKDKKEKIAKDKAEKRADADSAHKKGHDKVKDKVADAGKTESGKDKRDEKAQADAKSDKAAKPDEPSVAKKPAADQTPTGALRSEDPPAAAPLTGAQADAAGVTPEFRWPARGRIIQGFAAGGNDGINIAVPEGTSVKAAESGVVAYAGNELKGYGNLILIRHPNGFVTAYANNKELEVKRGDTVKRGQIIAKSGQSGNVSTPQLHFELRKGSTPVDPTSYLAGL